MIKVNIKEDRIWSKDFILIFIASFFIFNSFQMLMPVLPVFAKSLGADISTIGLVNGLFTISAVLSRPVVGYILDNRGRKKIYILGFIIFILSVIGYLFASSILMLLLLRFIHGFGWAGASTSAGTMVTDTLPKDRIGEGLGYYSIAPTLAMAISPFLALTVLKYSNSILVLKISLALSVLALFVGLFVKEQAIRKAKPLKQEKEVFYVDRLVLQISILMFLMTFSYGGIVSFLAIYASELGIDNIGPFFSIYALTIVLTRPLAGKYFDKHGAKLLVSFGFLSLFLSNIILSMANQLDFFLLAGFLFGIGFSFVHSSLLSLSLKNRPFHQRGKINGFLFSAFDLGIGIGSFALALVTKMSSYSTMYFMSSFFPLLGFLYFILNSRNYKNT